MTTETVRGGSYLRFVSFRGSFTCVSRHVPKADPRNNTKRRHKITRTWLEEMNMDRTIRTNSATAISLLGVVVFGAGWMQKQKEKRPMPEPLLFESDLRHPR